MEEFPGHSLVIFVSARYLQLPDVLSLPHTESIANVGVIPFSPLDFPYVLSVAPTGVCHTLLAGYWLSVVGSGAGAGAERYSPELAWGEGVMHGGTTDLSGVARRTAGSACHAARPTAMCAQSESGN